jgi:hypothetical protein
MHWRLEDYGKAARALGRFNGAYLTRRGSMRPPNPTSNSSSAFLRPSASALGRPLPRTGPTRRRRVHAPRHAQPLNAPRPGRLVGVMNSAVP